MNYLLVFLGGGLGAAARHAVNIVGARLGGFEFPFTTLAINVFGSFLMGIVVGYFAFAGQANQQLRLFLATGVLGGFTTFSTFSLEAVLLYERGELGAAAAYVLASVVLSLAGLLAGLALLREVS